MSQNNKSSIFLECPSASELIKPNVRCCLAAPELMSVGPWPNSPECPFVWELFFKEGHSSEGGRRVILVLQKKRYRTGTLKVGQSREKREE